MIFLAMNGSGPDRQFYVGTADILQDLLCAWVVNMQSAVPRPYVPAAIEDAVSNKRARGSVDPGVDDIIIQQLNFDGLMMEQYPKRDLGILEEIVRDPDATQANLAAKLDVAVGTVNWHLKRLIAKGYVKVKRAERRKLRYIITPEGLALRARLTMAYIENSMALYRETRRRARRVLAQARAQGYQTVCIQGDGDLAEVCRLTCLEQGFPVTRAVDGGGVAVMEIRGRTVVLHGRNLE